MLFHYLKNPGDQRYIEQLFLEINGNFDERLFEKSWNWVVAANEILRTLFRWENVSSPVQVILKEHRITPAHFNLLNTNAAEKSRLLEEIKRKDREDSFDLREVPFRVTLCKIDAGEYLVIISHHHILYDGWSSGIIVREFFEAYGFGLENPHLSFPPSPLPKAKFKDFIRWVQNKNLQEADVFWHNYLKARPTDGFFKTCALPLEIKRKPPQPGRIGSFELKIPAGVYERLDKTVKRYNITTAALMYGMWGLLLQQYHDVGDILFDTTTAVRPAEIKGIENSTGLYINTLPLRINTIPGETIHSFLTRIDHMLRQWREFSFTPRHRLDDYLEPFKNTLLFDPVLAIENYPLDIAAIQHNCRLKIKSFSSIERTYYDLTVIIILWEGLRFNFTYDAELFSAETVSCLGDDLLHLLNQLLDPCREKIEDITPVISEFREKLLTGPERVYPPANVNVDYAAPRDSVEENLVDTWSDLFRVKKSEIGIDSNFFDMGGHSLKASLLAGRVYDRFKVKLPLAVMFKNPTPRQLALYIKNAEKKIFVPIVPVEKKEYYTASPAQQRMFTLQQIYPGSIAYNVSTFFIIEGVFESKQVKALEHSFNTLSERHESLRTSFHMIGAVPVQRIHLQDYVDIQEIQSKVFGGAGTFFQKGSDPPEAIIKNFIRPFDLSRLPLLRTGLVKIAADRHLLMFDVHHIISDGTSMNVIIKEFMTVYSGENIPTPRTRYRDFSEWQKKQLKSAEIKQQGTYWLEVFNDEVPLLNIPTDYPRWRDGIAVENGGKNTPTIDIESHNDTGSGKPGGGTLYFTVNRETRQKLLFLEKISGATLYMILLAAYNVLLMRYSGQEDIVVGSVSSGRTHPHLENLIGVMISTLALRNYPYREKSFVDFLHEVKSNCLSAFENSDYPYEELLENIRFTREPGRNPLFDTMFLLQNHEWTMISLEDLVFKPYRFDNGASPFDIRITAVENDMGIDLEIKYSSRLFTRDTIRRLAGHYETILQDIGSDYRQRLGYLRLLTAEEQEEILYRFNEPGRRRESGNIEKKPVYRLFADQALKTPGSTAIVCDDLAAAGTGSEVITYEALNHSVEKIAGWLRKEGVQTGKPVGVLLPASPLAAAAILAVMKAGGTYIPIDPQYPLRRITGIINDAGTGFLLSNGKPAATGLEKVCPVKIIDPDSLESDPGKVGVGIPGPGTDIERPAYIIYTSGSTGKPRGAAVYQRGLFNLVNWFVTGFGLKESDSNILITSLSFDLTQKNIFAPLVSGGTIVMPGLSHFDPGHILEIIKKREITWLNCTPGMIYNMIDTADARDMEKLASLSYLFLGGEPVSISRLGKWVGSGYCRAEIINTYGPTECTDICAYYRIKQPGEFRGDRVPIGQPVYNARLFILDCFSRVLPVGVPGELYIGGEGVGSGYINNPGLTAEKFIIKSFSGGEGGRFFKKAPLLYKTGDLACWLPDGNIEFLGRIDNQVKIRGYRIELGEIENRLLKDKRIREAAVMVRKDAKGDNYLCAYIVSFEKIPVPGLREILAQGLPGYMIPAHFEFLEKIPLTPGGKIAKNALPEPGLTLGNSDYIAPRDDIEEKLVNIWAKVLGLKKEIIGINSNFFELGGHSLKVITALNTIEHELGIKCSSVDFLKNPTIKGISAFGSSGRIKGKEIVFDDINRKLGEKFGIPVKLVNFPVKGKEYVVLFADDKIAEILAFLENNELKEALPHYIRPTQKITPRKICDISDFMDYMDLKEPTKGNLTSLERSISDLLKESLVTFQQEIISGRIIDEYNCGGLISRYLDSEFRSLIPFIVLIHDEWNLEKLAKAATDFINSQSLLRSILIKENNRYRFAEYAGVEDLKLPILDLSDYVLEIPPVELLKFMVNFIKGVMISKSPLETVLFYAVIIKFNLREHLVLFLLDHKISDNESNRILQHYFEKTLKNKNTDGLYARIDPDEKRCYKNFIKEYMLPSAKAENILRFKAGNEYRAFKEEVNRLWNHFPEGKPIVFSGPFIIEFFLKKEKKIIPALGYVLYICTGVFRILFEIERIPLTILRNIRTYGGSIYYDIIGDMHDDIPVLFESKPSTTPGKCYRHWCRNYKKYADRELHFASMGYHDREIYRYILKNPIQLNYLGAISMHDEHIKLTSLKTVPHISYPNHAYSVDDKKIGIIIYNGLRVEKLSVIHSFLNGLPGEYTIYEADEIHQNKRSVKNV